MTNAISRRAALLGAAMFGFSHTARAETALPQPSGPVLLEVGGTIRLTNGAAGARFDRSMLDSLPQSGFVTASPWTEKPTRFDGVAGATLADAVGAYGRDVVATALNDYRVTIPLADFGPGGLLIASRADGNPIPIRARGPLWIVYPFDTNPAYRAELYFSRSIWQLKSLVFR